MSNPLKGLDSKQRKGIPLVTGLLDYFPDALIYIARVSQFGNDKHNPGEALYHNREKSTDEADSIARHLTERGFDDEESGLPASAHMAWRALSLLQKELEERGMATLARGARYPSRENQSAISVSPVLHVPGSIPQPFCQCPWCIDARTRLNI